MSAMLFPMAILLPRALKERLVNGNGWLQTVYNKFQNYSLLTFHQQNRSVKQ